MRPESLHLPYRCLGRSTTDRLMLPSRVSWLLSDRQGEENPFELHAELQATMQEHVSLARTEDRFEHRPWRKWYES